MIGNTLFPLSGEEADPPGTPFLAVSPDGSNRARILAAIAQLVERTPCKRGVGGSNPLGGTILVDCLH